MEREDITEMKDVELVRFFEKLLRQGAGSDFYLVVWAREELSTRLAQTRTTVDRHIERCPTCGEELADGVGHDHRDTTG